MIDEQNAIIADYRREMIRLIEERLRANEHWEST